MTSEKEQLSDIEVGGLLRARRKVIRRSQSYIAAQLGVSHQTVAKYERGGCRLSQARLKRWQHVLGIDHNFRTVKSAG